MDPLLHYAIEKRDDPDPVVGIHGVTVNALRSWGHHDLAEQLTQVVIAHGPNPPAFGEGS